jgi:hypothetical protein
MVENFSITRRMSTFKVLQLISIFLNSTIEVITYNRRERKDTYDVIGIMKGEIEPGTISYCFHMKSNYLSF